MPRIHERKELLLPEKTERCSLAKPRRCLRTECVISAVVLGRHRRTASRRGGMGVGGCGARRRRHRGGGTG